MKVTREQLGNSIPLRIKDWKALKAQGVTIDKLKEGDLELIASFTSYVLQKAGVGGDKVDDMTIGQMSEVVNMTLGAEEDAPDRPT